MQVGAKRLLLQPYVKSSSSPQYLAMPQAQATLPQFSSQIPFQGYASKDGYNITGEL
jgi:hypothetical protein